MIKFEHDIHGVNRYNPEQLSSLSGLLANLHRLAQIAAQGTFASKTPLNTYIYSASTCGMLAAMIFDQYENFNVRGYLDQKGALLNEVSHDLGVFFTQPRKVFNIETDCPTDIDLIICATAPDHYSLIQKKLTDRLPGVPVAYVHYSDKDKKKTPVSTAFGKPLVVATTGRCGTHWLKGLLRFLLGPFGYEELNASTSANGTRTIDHHVFSKLQHHQYVVDHFTLTPELCENSATGNFHTVFLYRDPRDIQVSTSFYWHKKFTFNAEIVSNQAQIISRWLKIENALHLRYEDLKSDTTATLQRLTDFMGVRVEKNVLEKISYFNSFQFLSGGRKPGQEECGHHYRKGIIGDWENYYDKAEKQLVKNLCGQELIDIGYERDLSW